ncbi:MAG: TIR domain-containing protein [Muribaculaceae bacterium]|jgi:hypothetical protein|nr:TIR domain-containing protein [Muribaculaceae bacterium]
MDVSNDTENKKLYDVFISYKHSSDSATAQLIMQSLVDYGYDKKRIFFDSKNIKEGSISKPIFEAFKSSRSYVVIFSKNCFDSSSSGDWFLKEIRMALESDMRIIPFYYGCSFEETMKSLEQVSFYSADDSIDAEKCHIEDKKYRTILKDIKGTIYNPETDGDIQSKIDDICEIIGKPKTSILSSVLLYFLAFIILFCCLYVAGMTYAYFSHDDSFSQKRFNHYTKMLDIGHYEYNDSVGLDVEYNAITDQLILHRDDYSDNVAVNLKVSDMLVYSFSAVSLGTLFKSVKKFHVHNEATAIGALVFIAGTILGFCEGELFTEKYLTHRELLRMNGYVLNKQNWQSRRNFYLKHMYENSLTRNAQFEYAYKFGA